MAAVVRATGLVFEVEDNYQKQTCRNRTFIAHSNGKLLLNAPVKHNKQGARQKTREVLVENSFPWQLQHWKSLQTAYRTSPFFEFYEDDLEPLFTEEVSGLMDHNFRIFDVLIQLIGVNLSYTKTTSYKNEPDIRDLRYLVDTKKMGKLNLQPYTQVLQAHHDFIPNLSILDLLFNEGPNALQYLEDQQIDF